MCFASDCCIREMPNGEKLFECFSHADRCHAGTGTYVILKSSMVTPKSQTIINLSTTFNNQ